jgi:hypothetical protein
MFTRQLDPEFNAEPIASQHATEPVAELCDPAYSCANIGAATGGERLPRHRCVPLRGMPASQADYDVTLSIICIETVPAVIAVGPFLLPLEESHEPEPLEDRPRWHEAVSDFWSFISAPGSACRYCSHSGGSQLPRRKLFVLDAGYRLHRRPRAGVAVGYG